MDNLELMSLDEFRQLDILKVRDRINEQLKLSNYSSKEAMASKGYGFSWTSMKNVAEEKGLLYGFYTTDDISNRDEPKIEVLLAAKQDPVRRTYALDRKDAKRLDNVLRIFKRSADKSAVVSTMIRYALDYFERAIEKGSIKVVYPSLEISVTQGDAGNAP